MAHGHSDAAIRLRMCGPGHVIDGSYRLAGGYAVLIREFGAGEECNPQPDACQATIWEIVE